MEILPWLKGILALTGAGIGWYFGETDKSLTILTVLIVIDYCTGVIAAIIDKKLCSEVGLKGIMKKVFIFVLVGVANLLDQSIFQNAVPLKESVIFFYIANESISITENAGRIGLPMPQKLKNVLTSLQDKKEDDKEKI